jgi:hypothetical protein
MVKKMKIKFSKHYCVSYVVQMFDCGFFESRSHPWTNKINNY